MPSRSDREKLVEDDRPSVGPRRGWGRGVAPEPADPDVAGEEGGGAARPVEPASLPAIAGGAARSLPRGIAMVAGPPRMLPRPRPSTPDIPRRPALASLSPARNRAET